MRAGASTGIISISKSVFQENKDPAQKSWFNSGSQNQNNTSCTKKSNQSPYLYIRPLLAAKK